MVNALVEAGMDAARLNFSHGTHEEHAERARLVREAQEHAGRPLALIADLQGPKLRIGELPGPVELAVGDEVLISGEGSAGPGDLPVAPPVISEMLRPGHEVLIAPARSLRGDDATAEAGSQPVLVCGMIGPHRGQRPVFRGRAALTEKNRAFAFRPLVGVDFFAFLRPLRNASAARELHPAGSAASHAQDR